MKTRLRSVERRIVGLALVLLLVLSSGCRAVEAHPVDGPYIEQDGMWCGYFGINPGGVRAAARTTLTELRMPIYQEGLLSHGFFIDTRTPENCEARLIIMPLDPNRGTCICVRVGGFGTHREVCERLLDEIAKRIDTIGRVPAEPTASVLPPVEMPGPAPAAPAPPPQPVPVK
jgi:hypothetical protein